MFRIMICGFVGFIVLGTGCQNRPFQMRGFVNMAGKMGVDGDVRMTGDVKTSVKADNTASRLTSVVIQSASKACNTSSKIAVIDVDGVLINKNITGMGSMGENPVALFREKLDALRCDPSIRGVVLRINSAGGGVTATDIMSRDLQQFRAQTNLPVVACLMDVGAGGAYLLATHADAIVAHPTSIVGGIGVILNIYNLEDAMGQVNIVSLPVKAGEHIDAASPERRLEDEEKIILQGIADGFHKRFIDHIKQTRPDTAADKENFDGRIFSGDIAAVRGLVDEVGYLDDAIAMARSRAGVGTDSAVVMLRRDNDRAYTQFDVTPNTPSPLLPIKVPGLDRSSLPTFLYLWQPDPSYLTSAGG